ncbi:MAG: polysaccharide biosynthesis C-terminal domain-containing protein [Coprococcus sp.]
MLITKPFLKIYVSAEYYNAWKYTPFLIVGCVYLTLSTFVATSYTVHKDSFGYLFSGMFGAICNVFLNFLWIPRIGVYGAALATGISYIAVFGFRILNTRKYIKYIIFYKEFIVGSVLLILSGVSMYNDNAIGVILQIFSFVIGFFAFFRIWGKIFKELAQKILRKKE